MSKKGKKFISEFYGNRDAKESLKSPELVMRESFLRMAKEQLDSFGVESYSIEQIRGGLMMLEKFNEMEQEV